MNLIVTGPPNFFDRSIITDALVDTLCDYEINKILIANINDLDKIVTELCYISGMIYDQYVIDEKHGKSSKSILYDQMTRDAHYILIIGDKRESDRDLLYFADRHGLQIINYIIEEV